MSGHRIKHQILDYLYDIIGYSEILDASRKTLRDAILNKSPHEIPAYLSEEIKTSVDGTDGKNFSNFLSSTGILSPPGQILDEESFIYLKNKAELQNPGRTLFN